MKKVIKYFSETWDYTILKHREFFVLIDNQAEEVELMTENELKDYMLYVLNGVISNNLKSDFILDCEYMVKRSNNL